LSLAWPFGLSVLHRNISRVLSSGSAIAKLICDIGKHSIAALRKLPHLPFKQPNLSMVSAGASSLNAALQMSGLRAQRFKFHPS